MEEREGKKLNWKQACEVLGCSKRRFYLLINTGRLTAFRVEGSKRGLWVWEDDVKALIKPVCDNA